MNTQYSTGAGSIVLILLTAAAILLIIWFQNQIPGGEPTVTFNKSAVPQAATTSAPADELEQIDLGDLDKEFEAVDRDISAL